MLAFDLPDYSKSSTAQNEKLARERNRDWRRRRRRRRRRKEGGGILQGPDIHPVSPKLSPNSSPLASCFQEIWCGCDVWVRGDTIGTVANIAAEREREREKEKDEEEKRERESRYPSLMMSLFIPPPVFKTHSALRVCGRRSNDSMR